MATNSADKKMGDQENPKSSDKTAASMVGCSNQWLQQYLAKMKAEIKQEILEELANNKTQARKMFDEIPYPEIGVQEAMALAQHSKTAEATKMFDGIQCPDLKPVSFPQISKTDEACVKDIQLPPVQDVQYQGEVVHTGIYCDNCDQLIHGIRYKCGNCSDFDLCQECESLPVVHNKNHIFLKIRYPFALRMYQKQKWQELMSPLPVKPSRYSDSGFYKNHSKKLYEAKFLCDETVPDNTVIPPSTQFVKSWKVMNIGTRVWTHATKLHMIQGSADFSPFSRQVDVPHLKPGEEGVVSVLFTSPAAPGVYRSHWNFCHRNRPFGHIVWCHIIVKSQEESNTEQSAEINPLSEKIVNKQPEVSSIAQVLTAVKENREEDNMIPRKLVVNSHTATPNNTPFVLTPPKSPDHESLNKSVQEIASDKTFSSQTLFSNEIQQNSNESDDDDICSIVSVSSSDSETEFVVIPMPKCFNLSESYVSEHLQQLTLTLPEHEAVLKSNSVPTENACLKIQKGHEDKKNISKKPSGSETVSQETGVPELSENTCEPLISIVESLVNNQKTTHISQVHSDGSSSEISVLESGCNSPSAENATQIFDSISVKFTTTDSASSEVNRIEVSLDEDSKKASAVEMPNKAVNKEQVITINDIPNNGSTFPKFPVEGVTNNLYEGTSANNSQNPEERTIQVLPEGLVIGALSAAASVYNTARAVISTIQQPRAEGLAQPLPRTSGVQQEPPVTTVQSPSMQAMDQLIEMGFCNRQQNEMLLKKHKGDVALVVAELVNMNDNDWYNSRHVPRSPPGFLD